MNIFKDFDEVFALNGLVTIVFVEDSIKKFCKSKIKQIGEDLICLNVEEDVSIPSNQVLSVIYSSSKGLYGFHANIIENFKSKRISITKPKEGWQIQRRKYDRINIVNKGLIDKGISLGADLKREDCLILNIGDSGIAFQTSSDLSISQEFRIYIEINDIVIDEECCIIWKNEILEKDQEYGYKYMYGVKFIFVNNKLRKKIDQIKKKNIV